MTATSAAAHPAGPGSSAPAAEAAAPAAPSDPADVASTGEPGDRTALAVVPQPEFDRLDDWLSEYFLPMFRRTLGCEFRWCRQWWRRGEAISRLTALWHSWEVLRTQPGTGIGTWYREHLDHQLPIPLGSRGPFYQCSETTHREPHQATTDPAPDDWWDPPVPEPSAAAQAAGGAVAGGERVADVAEGAVAGHGRR